MILVKMMMMIRQDNNQGTALSGTILVFQKIVVIKAIQSNDILCGLRYHFLFLLLQNRVSRVKSLQETHCSKNVCLR
jgi:hypothetical protein